MLEEKHINPRKHVGNSSGDVEPKDVRETSSQGTRYSVLFSYCQYRKWGRLTLAQMYAPPPPPLCLCVCACVCFLQCDREADRSVDRGLTGVKWGSSQETQALNKVHTQTIIHSYTYSGQQGNLAFAVKVPQPQLRCTYDIVTSITLRLLSDLRTSALKTKHWITQDL